MKRLDLTVRNLSSASLDEADLSTASGGFHKEVFEPNKYDDVISKYGMKDVKKWQKQGDGDNSTSDVPVDAQEAWGWKVTDEEKK
jgi:hypothetical protein